MNMSVMTINKNMKKTNINKCIPYILLTLVLFLFYFLRDCHYK